MCRALLVSLVKGLLVRVLSYTIVDVLLCVAPNQQCQRRVVIETWLNLTDLT